MTLRCFLLHRAAAALWPATLQIIGFVLQPLNHFLIPFFMTSGVPVPRYSYVAQTRACSASKTALLSHRRLTFSLPVSFPGVSNMWLWPPAVIAAEPIKSLLTYYVKRNKQAYHQKCSACKCRKRRNGTNVRCYFRLYVCACALTALFRLTTPVRKFSQNLNAGHKSASHGWIIEEYPMLQASGAAPTGEQRAAYLLQHAAVHMAINCAGTATSEISYFWSASW